jgi:hypothetical protein
MNSLFAICPATKPPDLRLNYLNERGLFAKFQFSSKPFATKLKRLKTYVYQWFVSRKEGFDSKIAGGYFLPCFWGKKRGRDKRGINLRPNLLLSQNHRKGRCPQSWPMSPSTGPDRWIFSPMLYLRKPLILKAIWRWPERMARLCLDYWKGDKI